MNRKLGTGSLRIGTNMKLNWNKKPRVNKTGDQKLFTELFILFLLPPFSIQAPLHLTRRQVKCRIVSASFSSVMIKKPSCPASLSWAGGFKLLLNQVTQSYKMKHLTLSLKASLCISLGLHTPIILHKASAFSISRFLKYSPSWCQRRLQRRPPSQCSSCPPPPLSFSTLKGKFRLELKIQDFWKRSGETDL